MANTALALVTRTMKSASMLHVANMLANEPTFKLTLKCLSLRSSVKEFVTFSFSVLNLNQT